MDGRHSRRRFLAAVGAASAVALPGCGGDGDGTATEAGPDGATASPSPTKTAVPTEATAASTSATTRPPTTESPTATPERELSIEVPVDHPQDRPAEIRVTGAESGARVTVEASMRDYRGQVWRSTQTFEADENGAVSLASSAPVEAEYEGVDPMGWVWSMTGPRGQSFAHPWHDDWAEISFTASGPGSYGETTVRRQLNHPDVSLRVVETDDLVGRYYDPPGDGPHPGVIALHGSGGTIPHRRAELLATRGYATFAVQYFGDPDPIPDVHDSVPLSYFERAQSWLRDREAVRDAPVGVVGISRGGELALLLGARFDWVGAVVSYVGSAVGWEGGSDDPPVPAWTHDGDPVQHLTWHGQSAVTEEGNYHFRPVVDRRLERVSEREREDATYALEETDAPLLMISAGDDQVWPSKALSEDGAERLREHDVDFPWEHLVYEDAGHYVTAPYLPTTGRRVVSNQLMGGTPSGHARADAESWPAVLDCLGEGIGE